MELLRHFQAPEKDTRQDGLQEIYTFRDSGGRFSMSGPSTGIVSTMTEGSTETEHLTMPLVSMPVLLPVPMAHSCILRSQSTPRACR